MLLLAACALLRLAGPCAGSVETPEQIRKARAYRTPSWRKALSAPRTLFELPFLPIKRSVIFAEKVDLIERITDVLYNRERTFGRIPTFSYQGELGTGLGFTLFHTDLFRRRYGGNLSFLYSDPDDLSLRASFSSPYRGRHPRRARWSAYFLYREDADENFYIRSDPALGPVVGDGTVPEDAKSYAFNFMESRAQLNVAFTPRTWARLRLSGLRIQTGPGRGAARLELDPGGLGADLPMAGAGASVSRDTRDHPHRPVRGAFLEAGGDALQGLSGGEQARGSGFVRTHAEVQEFLPLPWGPQRTFLMRGSVEKLEPFPGKAVPFYFLPRLDQNHGLRGFDRNRFQNRGALVFNLEYRYPIWETWDGVIFLDHGRTFHEYRDLRVVTSFQRAYGTAIHFLSENGFLFLLQYGRSGDQFGVVFSLQQAF